VLRMQQNLRHCSCSSFLGKPLTIKREKVYRHQLKLFSSRPLDQVLTPTKESARGQTQRFVLCGNNQAHAHC